MNKPPGRPGIAAIWLLVVLAALSMLSAAVVGQLSAARRQVDAHRNRLEAEWLARAGYELAVAHLLAEPNGYTGETVKPIPGGEVKIVVRKEPGDNGPYKVDCEARYPVGERNVVVKVVQRACKRVEGPGGARIEAATVTPQ
jgi:hypothetical protein